MARPDLDPIAIEAAARALQQRVFDDYKLHGQRDGTDQPEYFDRLPFTGLHAWLSQVFEQLVIVLVIFLVVGMTIGGGPTP